MHHHAKTTLLVMCDVVDCCQLVVASQSIVVASQSIVVASQSIVVASQSIDDIQLSIHETTLLFYLIVVKRHQY